MDQSQNGVENTEQQAPVVQEGVENKASAAPHDDPEAKLAALLEENEKLRRDRDNYRSATLAMKGKKEIEDIDLTDPAQLQAYIDKTVGDRLLETREAQTKAELETFTKELARKNKELSLALANRSQVVVAGTGSGESNVESKNNGYWSPEQAAEMKKRWQKQGIPEERIKVMLQKAEEKSRLS